MNRRRGLAILSALLALVVVALAITALSGYVSDDAHRTMDLATDAQLEQMLLAGTIDARSHLGANAVTTDQSWEIELPPSLVEQGGTLHTDIISTSENGPALLRITARLQRRMSSQLVRFNRIDNGWKLAATEFEG